jgi:hypothetical protein
MENRFEEVMGAIKEVRSNEAHFEKLVALLQKECAAAGNPEYRQKLEALSQKEATAYRQAKEKGGTAWPEYEHFVTGFEKAVLEANQQ